MGRARQAGRSQTTGLGEEHAQAAQTEHHRDAAPGLVCERRVDAGAGDGDRRRLGARRHECDRQREAQAQAPLRHHVDQSDQADRSSPSFTAPTARTARMARMARMATKGATGRDRCDRAQPAATGAAGAVAGYSASNGIGHGSPSGASDGTFVTVASKALPAGQLPRDSAQTSSVNATANTATARSGTSHPNATIFFGATDVDESQAEGTSGARVPR